MKKYISMLFVLIGMWSCGNILDLEPVGNRTDASYWESEQDMFDAIVGAYSLLNSRNLGMHEMFFDNQGDDQWRAGDHAEDEDIETGKTNPSNYKLLETYYDKYEVISRANGVIINGPKVKAFGEISDDAYNGLMGEAYFLRAWAYYRLLLIHGQVPIILEDNVLTNNYNVPKCDAPDVLRDLIISDLGQAVNLLPITYETGRVNRGAAWALLVSIHMDHAEDFSDAEHLGKAIQYGEMVISNYALADDYESLFRTGNEPLEELLFYMANDMDWLNGNVMSKHRGPRPWGMYSFQEPLTDLVNEFEAGDIRKKVTIVSDGDSVYQGSEIGWATHTSDLSLTGHSYYKYMQWRDDGWFINGISIPLLRAGETYLRVAEAKIRLNGPGAGDAEINAIRARAKLAPISNGDIHDLIHESRCETAGENFRYQNLLRWDKAGILDLTTFLANSDKMIPNDVGRKTWSRPKNYYQPLPQLEIDNSGGVLLQNPHWTTSTN